MRRDLDRLLARLRREAGIDIALAGPGEAANLTVSAISATTSAGSCRRRPVSWSPASPGFPSTAIAAAPPKPTGRRLHERRKVAVFVPVDAPPQEMRDCLHEELAQAIGPLNDLYRLPDSVFNDDNVHAVLTGFDMLVLRAYYATGLRSGMTRAQVARRLPGILARLNPGGEHLPPAPPADARAPGSRRWKPRWAATARAPAAPRRPRGVAIARAEGWADHRAGLRAVTRSGGCCRPPTRDRRCAISCRRRQIYARPETALHRAHVDGHLAAFALRAVMPPRRHRIVASTRPAARAENAALMSTLMMLRPRR